MGNKGRLYLAETLSLDSVKGAAFEIRQGTQSPAPRILLDSW